MYKIGDAVRWEGDDWQAIYYIVAIHNDVTPVTYDISLSQDGPVAERNVPDGGLKIA